MSSNQETDADDKMPVPARLSIVTLGVADLGRATAFYKDLGWTLAPASSDEIVWFLTSDSALGLYPLDELAADAGLKPGSPGDFGGVMLGLNVERAEQVDEVLAAVVAVGGRIVAEPELAEWGGYRGYFADPDGHTWEVLYHPYMSFAADGSLDLG